MTIPQQVQAAADRADELMKGDGKQDGEKVELNIDPEILNPGEKKAEPKPDPKPAENDPPPKQPQQDAAPGKDSEDQGELSRLRTETGTLNQLNKSLDNQNRHLKIKCSDYERKIQELEAGIAGQKDVKEGQKPAQSGLSPEQLQILKDEGFSDELVEIFESRQSSGNSEELEKVKQELSTVKQDAAQTKEGRFWDALTRQVPDWESVNANPEFITWLQNMVPYQNYTVGEVLNHSRQQLDFQMVSQIFNDFKTANNNNNPEPQNKQDDPIELFFLAVEFEIMTVLENIYVHQQSLTRAGGTPICQFPQIIRGVRLDLRTGG